MKDRYKICELQICPFDIIITENKTKFYKADRNNFPYRLCVMDKKLKKAIDVLSEKCYDYIEMSIVYFLGNEASKIKKNNRYAILPMNVDFRKYSDEEIKKAEKIKNNMLAGIIYEDGNNYSNEEYLESIKQVEKTNKKIKKK